MTVLALIEAVTPQHGWKSWRGKGVGVAWREEYEWIAGIASCLKKGKKVELTLM